MPVLDNFAPVLPRKKFLGLAGKDGSASKGAFESLATVHKGGESDEPEVSETDAAAYENPGVYADMR
jgi:hypothetical protein